MVEPLWNSDGPKDSEEEYTEQFQIFCVVSIHLFNKYYWNSLKIVENQNDANMLNS